MLRVGRGIFFLIGLNGLALLLFSFWVSTAQIGGVLCAGALIGHMATWNIRIENKVDEHDVTS